jgi:hypothetical protein
MSLQMEISKYLRDYSRTIMGKQQLIIGALAKALEIIPRQIIQRRFLSQRDAKGLTSAAPPPATIVLFFMGKQQLIIGALAKALEIIPRQICDNAGFDATDVLNKALLNAFVLTSAGSHTKFLKLSLTPSVSTSTPAQTSPLACCMRSLFKTSECVEQCSRGGDVDFKCG